MRHDKHQPPCSSLISSCGKRGCTSPPPSEDRLCQKGNSHTRQSCLHNECCLNRTQQEKKGSHARVPVQCWGGQGQQGVKAHRWSTGQGLCSWFQSILTVSSGIFRSVNRGSGTSYLCRYGNTSVRTDGCRTLNGSINTLAS